jgi:hypothetical protein
MNIKKYFLISGASAVLIALVTWACCNKPQPQVSPRVGDDYNNPNNNQSASTSTLINENVFLSQAPLVSAFEIKSTSVAMQGGDTRVVSAFSTHILDGLGILSSFLIPQVGSALGYASSGSDSQFQNWTVSSGITTPAFTSGIVCVTNADCTSHHNFPFCDTALAGVLKNPPYSGPCNDNDDCSSHVCTSHVCQAVCTGQLSFPLPLPENGLTCDVAASQFTPNGIPLATRCTAGGMWDNAWISSAGYQPTSNKNDVVAVLGLEQILYLGAPYPAIPTAGCPAGYFAPDNGCSAGANNYPGCSAGGNGCSGNVCGIGCGYACAVDTDCNQNNFFAPSTHGVCDQNTGLCVNDCPQGPGWSGVCVANVCQNDCGPSATCTAGNCVGPGANDGSCCSNVCNNGTCTNTTAPTPSGLGNVQGLTQGQDVVMSVSTDGGRTFKKSTTISMGASADDVTFGSGAADAPVMDIDRVNHHFHVMWDVPPSIAVAVGTQQFTGPFLAEVPVSQDGNFMYTNLGGGRLSPRTNFVNLSNCTDPAGNTGVPCLNSSTIWRGGRPVPTSSSSFSYTSAAQDPSDTSRFLEAGAVSQMVMGVRGRPSTCGGSGHDPCPPRIYVLYPTAVVTNAYREPVGAFLGTFDPTIGGVDAGIPPFSASNQPTPFSHTDDAGTSYYGGMRPLALFGLLACNNCQSWERYDQVSNTFFGAAQSPPSVEGIVWNLSYSDNPYSGKQKDWKNVVLGNDLDPQGNPAWAQCLTNAPNAGVYNQLTSGGVTIPGGGNGNNWYKPALTVNPYWNGTDNSTPAEVVGVLSRPSFDEHGGYKGSRAFAFQWPAATPGQPYDEFVSLLDPNNASPIVAVTPNTNGAGQTIPQDVSGNQYGAAISVSCADSPCTPQSRVYAAVTFHSTRNSANGGPTQPAGGFVAGTSDPATSAPCAECPGATFPDGGAIPLCSNSTFDPTISDAGTNFCGCGDPTAGGLACTSPPSVSPSVVLPGSCGGFNTLVQSSACPGPGIFGGAASSGTFAGLINDHNFAGSTNPSVATCAQAGLPTPPQDSCCQNGNQHLPYRNDVEGFTFLVGSTNRSSNINGTLKALSRISAHAPGGSIPWQESVIPSNTEFGDYDQGIVGVPPQPFAPQGQAVFQHVWSDNRNWANANGTGIYSQMFTQTFSTK